jgi:hypothetical protein
LFFYYDVAACGITFLVLLAEENFEGTKGVTTSKLVRERQYNGQTKKEFSVHPSESID